MRPEVRAEYERARARLDGDDAFATRFERFFTELRDPLVALYGDDPRFPAQFGALLDAMARAAAARDPELRRLDHEREITPDWLQREQAVGYVSYVDRFAGTLRRRPRAAPLPARARRHLPAPDAAAARAARAQRRRLRGRRLRRGRARAGHDGRPARARGRPARARDGAVRRRRRSTTPRASTPWAQAALAGDERKLAYYRTFPDRTEPDAYERTLPEVFPDIAPGNFTWVAGAGALGVDDVQRLPVGPRLHEPRGLPRDGGGDARPRRRRGRRAAPRRRAVPVEAARARTARTSPRSTSCCRRSARCCGSPRRPSPSRPRRSSRRASSSATSAPGRHEGKECDLAYHNVLMVLLWSALASGRVALMTRDAASMPAVAAGRGLGDLRALPRRHRLGDHRGGRGGGRRGRPPAPALPRRLLRRRLPRLVRARRAVPARRARRARRARAGRAASLAGLEAALGAATSSPSSSRSAGCCSCTRSRSPTAGCR